MGKVHAQQKKCTPCTLHFCLSLFRAPEPSVRPRARMSRRSHTSFLLLSGTQFPFGMGEGRELRRRGVPHDISKPHVCIVYVWDSWWNGSDCPLMNPNNADRLKLRYHYRGTWPRKEVAQTFGLKYRHHFENTTSDCHHGEQSKAKALLPCYPSISYHKRNVEIHPRRWQHNCMNFIMYMNARKFKRFFPFSNYIIKSTMFTRKKAGGCHQIQIKFLLDEVNFHSTHN